MLTIGTTIQHIARPVMDEADLAAAAFLARYNGRTLEAYQSDLRSFFQWTGEMGLVWWRRVR